MRVLIVDDHAGFRSAARQILEGAGYEVVGEAATGADGLDATPRLQAELVLLDLQLPDIDGITVAHRLAELADPPAVVLTSSRSAGAWGERLRTAPCAGFLPKAELSGAGLRELLG